MSEEPGSRPTMNEAMESLNGFEVIAIEDQFGGREFTELTGTRLTIGVVAMLRKRDGMTSKDAWQAARSLTLKQLNAEFAPEPSAADELAGQDDPAGKGGSATAPANGHGPHTSSDWGSGSALTTSAP